MTGQTPNHNIRYPEMTDRANISAIQAMSEDVEREVNSVQSPLVTQAASKSKWTRLLWNPTFTGMTIGNGTVIANAFRMDKLVWLDLSIFSIAAPSISTTKWSTGTTASSFSIPAASAVNNLVWAWHYPGVGTGSIRYLVSVLGAGQSTISIQVPLMAGNAAYPSIQSYYYNDLAANTGRPAGSAWSTSGYFMMRMLYRSM